MPPVTESLPLNEATFTPPPSETKTKLEPEVVVPEQPPKDALVMEADQVRAGSIRFLNDAWRVDVNVINPISGKIPSLRYQIHNKGQARVTLRGKVTCRVDIFSGLHNDGTLAVKSRGAARCSDGECFNLPDAMTT